MILVFIYIFQKKLFFQIIFKKIPKFFSKKGCFNTTCRLRNLQPSFNCPLNDTSVGVICDNDGHIEHIDLFKNDLKGFINENIGQFHFLKTIDL